MNLDPKFKQSKGIVRELKSHLHGQGMAQRGCQIWFFHITDFPDCVAAPQLWPVHQRGPCIWDVTTGTVPFPEPSSAVLECCWMPSWLQSCPGGQCARAGSVVRVTVLHQAVGHVAAVKDTFVVAFLCKCVHCPGNHLDSSGRPVPHIVPARNRDTLRGAWHCTELRQTVLRPQLSFGLASASHQGTRVHHLVQCCLFVFSHRKQAKATTLWD